MVPCTWVVRRMRIALLRQFVENHSVCGVVYSRRTYRSTRLVRRVGGVGGGKETYREISFVLCSPTQFICSREKIQNWFWCASRSDVLRRHDNVIIIICYPFFDRPRVDFSGIERRVIRLRVCVWDVLNGYLGPIILYHVAVIIFTVRLPSVWTIIIFFLWW